MPKVKQDLQKFVIISAAVTGIGLFWWQTTSKCYETVVSIVRNQLIVATEDVEKNKKIREQIENIFSLFKQVIEDIQKINKALQDGEAFQEIGNELLKNHKRMRLELKRLSKKDFHQLEKETIRRFKYYVSEYGKNHKELSKNIQEWRNAQEGRGEVQQLLTRLCERRHLENEKIRLLVKG